MQKIEFYLFNYLLLNTNNKTISMEYYLVKLFKHDIESGWSENGDGIVVFDSIKLSMDENLIFLKVFKVDGEMEKKTFDVKILLESGNLIYEQILTNQFLECVKFSESPVGGYTVKIMRDHRIGIKFDADSSS